MVLLLIFWLNVGLLQDDILKSDGQVQTDAMENGKQSKVGILYKYSK